MAKHKPKSIDSVFHSLLKEGKKESRKKETFSESKRRRIEKTKKNLMELKFSYDLKGREEVKGTFERHHLLATIARETCGCCGETKDRIRDIYLVRKSTKTGENQKDSLINSPGLYKLNADLPIVTMQVREWLPACVKCVVEDQIKRNKDGNGN